MPNWGIQSKPQGTAASHTLGNSANNDFGFGTGNFTVEFCVESRNDLSVGYNGPLSYYNLYYQSSNMISSGGTVSGFGIGVNPNNPWTPVFRCGDITNQQGAGAQAFSQANYRIGRVQGAVFYFAGVRDGLTTKFYTDGKLIHSSTTTGIAAVANNQAMKFGYLETTVYIRFSNVARSDEWIRSHYQDKYYKDSNTYALYNFTTENGAGTTIYDTSGNNRHGTLNATYGRWVKVSNVYEGQKMPAGLINDMAGQVADYPLITKQWSVVDELCQGVEGSPSYKTVFDYPSDTTFRIADATYSLSAVITAGSSKCRVIGKWSTEKTISVRANDGTYTTLTVPSHGFSGAAGGQEFLKTSI